MEAVKFGFGEHLLCSKGLYMIQYHVKLLLSKGGVYHGNRILPVVRGIPSFRAGLLSRE